MDYKMVAPEPRAIYNRLKASAKRRGIPFDLNVTDLYYIDYPIQCPILHIPLRWNIGRPKDDSYSFDRIDSSSGYSLANLQIISWKANRSKNNLTEDEIRKFCVFYKE